MDESNNDSSKHSPQNNVLKTKVLNIVSSKRNLASKLNSEDEDEEQETTPPSKKKRYREPTTSPHCPHDRSTAKSSSSRKKHSTHSVNDPDYDPKKH